MRNFNSANTLIKVVKQITLFAPSGKNFTEVSNVNRISKTS